MVVTKIRRKLTDFLYRAPMLMNSAKKTIAPVTAGTLAMVSLCMAGVELLMWTMYRYANVSPLLFLGASRIIEGAVMLGAAFVSQHRLWVLGLSRGTILAGARKGLLWSAGFAIVLLVVCPALVMMGIDPSGFVKTALPSKPNRLLLFILVGGILSPVAEELFFRGFLYGFLRRWGALLAVVTSSLLFALLHVALKGSFLVPVTGGLILAVLYEIERNLMAPITLHMLGNLTIFSISVLLR
ncbi:MAG: CPBP family intramembrane metalloprotease [Deltaproteobacteria bacterium]|nr:CPBP family intramembrane metalloprotease [Deltaproteobacteria bacterium]